MKAHFKRLCLFLTLGLTCLSAPAHATEIEVTERKSDGLQVSGRGVMSRPADSFRVIFQLEANEKTLTDSILTIDKLQSQINSCIEKRKISPKAREQSTYIFENSYAFGQALAGHTFSSKFSSKIDLNSAETRVLKSIGITLANDKDVAFLLQDTAAIDGVKLNSVNIETSEIQALVEGARARACEAATSTANAMAKQLNMKLGRVIRVSEKSIKTNFLNKLPRAGDSEIVDYVAQPIRTNDYRLGEICATSDISVLFELLP